MPETYHRGRKPFWGIGTSVVVAAALAWACLRWKPSRVAIEGGSMAPTLLPGDWALTVPSRRPKVGDVVVVEHPGRPGFEMVKRIVAAPGGRVGGPGRGAHAWWVEGGLPPAAPHTRQVGPGHGDALRAKVALIYWPRERRRRV